MALVVDGGIEKGAKAIAERLLNFITTSSAIKGCMVLIYFNDRALGFYHSFENL